MAANDDDDSGQGLGRWSKISTTTVESRDLRVIQDFHDDDWLSTSRWSTRPAAGRPAAGRPAAGRRKARTANPRISSRVRPANPNWTQSATQSANREPANFVATPPISYIYIEREVYIFWLIVHSVGPSIPPNLLRSARRRAR